MIGAILFLATARAQVELPPKTSLHIGYNQETSLVEFTARVRHNAYIALGFGESMENTDMIIWQANGFSSK